VLEDNWIILQDEPNNKDAVEKVKNSIKNLNKQRTGDE
jgi:hypothetical protein